MYCRKSVTSYVSQLLPCTDRRAGDERAGKEDGKIRRKRRRGRGRGVGKKEEEEAEEEEEENEGLFLRQKWDRTVSFTEP